MPSKQIGYKSNPKFNQLSKDAAKNMKMNVLLSEKYSRYNFPAMKIDESMKD